MQLGSGTYDALPGITYLAQYGQFSWGAQATATIRLGGNDRDYNWKIATTFKPGCKSPSTNTFRFQPELITKTGVILMAKMRV